MDGRLDDGSSHSLRPYARGRPTPARITIRAQPFYALSDVQQTEKDATAGQPGHPRGRAPNPPAPVCRGGTAISTPNGRRAWEVLAVGGLDTRGRILLPCGDGVLVDRRSPLPRPGEVTHGVSTSIATARY